MPERYSFHLRRSALGLRFATTRYQAFCDKMSLDQLTESTVQVALFELAKNFLTSLQSGATNEELATILADMREKEQLLFRTQGLMLDPELWRILHNRLSKK